MRRPKLLQPRPTFDTISPDLPKLGDYLVDAPNLCYNKGVKSPKTLLEATRLFSTPEAAHAYFTQLRWPDGVIPCPECGGTDHYFLKTRRIWKCKACKRQFSVKVGTIFEDSPLGLDKWLTATWLVVSAKNGISSCELSRLLGVNQTTAWFMLHRIRAAMANGTFEKLCDDVEADETGIGGLSKNMHKHVRERRITGTGFTNKTIVVGALERGGEIRLKVMPNNERESLHTFVSTNVLKGCNLYTDAHHGYTGLAAIYAHQIVDHAYTYVVDNVHTNGLENFWSLLKRTMRGTYVSVEPFHLFRYLDEYAFRFNERRVSDGNRFNLLLSQVAGKRLTYSALTGKTYN